MRLRSSLFSITALVVACALADRDGAVFKVDLRNNMIDSSYDPPFVIVNCGLDRLARENHDHRCHAYHE